MDLIDRNRDELDALCRHHHVVRLELFGSAARGEFMPGSSDLDFNVVFGDVPEGQSFRNFFLLKGALEALFGCPVDLVMLAASRNPYFCREALRDIEVIYDAA